MVHGNDDARVSSIVAFGVPCVLIKISSEAVDQFPFTLVSPVAAQQ